MAEGQDTRLRLLVSSSVHGKEPMLDQIYGVLDALGYKVWMSYKGTIPILPGKSNFECCLHAVENCDLFFGIITPNYGSGAAPGDLSITHRELLKAIELEKPRFMLAHENVVLARRLLKDLGYKTASERAMLALRKGAAVVDDLRLIDMYEAATREDLPLAERKDNWVQPYWNTPDVVRYVGEQFERYDELNEFVTEWRAKKGVAP